MSKAGCTVLALERNPVVYALLEDGLARHRQLGSEEAEIVSSLEIRKQDFLLAGSSLPEFQVVYLDPMFPPKTKTAQSKKAMSYLQELIAENSDEAAMFEAARTVASERVVVKRAKQSP